jgi:hypothetical protein
MSILEGVSNPTSEGLVANKFNAIIGDIPLVYLLADLFSDWRMKKKNPLFQFFEKKKGKKARFIDWWKIPTSVGQKKRQDNVVVA